MTLQNGKGSLRVTIVRAMLIVIGVGAFWGTTLGHSFTPGDCKDISAKTCRELCDRFESDLESTDHLECITESMQKRHQEYRQDSYPADIPLEGDEATTLL